MLTMKCTKLSIKRVLLIQQFLKYATQLNRVKVLNLMVLGHKMEKTLLTLSSDNASSNVDEALGSFSLLLVGCITPIFLYHMLIRNVYWKSKEPDDLEGNFPAWNFFQVPGIKPKASLMQSYALPLTIISQTPDFMVLR